MFNFPETNHDFFRIFFFSSLDKVNGNEKSRVSKNPTELAGHIIVKKELKKKKIL